MLPTVASLPLAAGYGQNFYRSDLLAQKILPCQLQVLGEETVERESQLVPAWKVSLTCGDGEERTTLWVAKENKEVLKSAGSSARMPNATFTRLLRP
jgi:hypothetical protein